MIVKVFRFDQCGKKAPYYSTYDVNITATDRMTVMELLEYIAERLDASIAFYSHSACHHGICGRCGIKVNGKACLACSTLLTGEDITLDPINQDIVKDLVVRS